MGSYPAPRAPLSPAMRLAIANWYIQGNKATVCPPALANYRPAPAKPAIHAN